MEILANDGFFKTFGKQVRVSVHETEFKRFGELCTDTERFDFVHNLKAAREFIVAESMCDKHTDIANVYRKDGNAAFQKNNWPLALDFYNRSYLALPNERDGDIAIVFANRSAALYHMEKYDAALTEIDRALCLGYPKDIEYKLIERRARCHLAKKQMPEAVQSFRDTIQALDNGKLPSEKRSKMSMDSQIMIKLLSRSIENEKQAKKQQQPQSQSQQQQQQELHNTKMVDTKHNRHPLKGKENFINSSLTFDCNAIEGRFARATKDIQINEKIVVEKPHVTALLEPYAKTHCQHCFERTIAPLACPSCTHVIFCSSECQEIALTTYHKYECPTLYWLWRSGSSIICHLALRMIAQKSYDYFEQFLQKSSFEKKTFFTELDNDDYRKVYNLVMHADKRSANDFFQHAAMASFLLKCLVVGKFFPENATDEMHNRIGGLLLRNLQLLQFNTHEVFELQQDSCREINRSVFIGGGLYPTVSLFNHSCDPGIVRYFNGNTMCLRAIKKIRESEQISENYGPIYTQKSRPERQQLLKSQYLFDCSCAPCQLNWPLFKDMDTTSLRFRCESNTGCTNVLVIPADSNDFMIQCVACGHFTNLLKGLKAMQDTELMTRTADRLYNDGKVESALVKYLEIFKTMEEVLAPPFKDFTLCQQNIRNCLLEKGNRHLLPN